MFLIVFIFQLKQTMVWSEIGVFDQFDVIFDSDPNLWIHMFAHGWGANTLLHPFCNYLFTIPIRIFEAVASIAGQVDDPVMFREAIVLYISPVCSAIMAVSIYAIFRLLEFDSLKACLVSCLAVLGFSSLTFGSIPSVYTLTSFSNALLMLLAILYSMKASRFTYISFVIVSLFTVSITVSNIIHVGWVYWFMFLAKGDQPMPALVKSVTRSTLILMAIVSAFLVIDRLTEREDTKGVSETIRYIELFTPTPMEQVTKIARFPEIVARTIIPTVPVEMPSYPGTELGEAIKVQVSISEIEFGLPSVFFSIVSIIAIGGGALIAYRLDGLWRHMALASLATLLTFGMLHSLFGQYIYLYSQTWYVPCIFLLGAWLNTSFFGTRAGYSVIGVMLLLLLLGDIYVLNHITQTVTPSIFNGA